MRAKIPFHIQQNTTPEVLRVILERYYEGHVTKSELAQELAMRIGTVQHIVPFVRQLGLLDTSSLSLTKLGKQFHQLNQQSPILLPEAVHHLLYTAHIFNETKRFSWAYARVVDALWTSGERILDGETRAQLVGMVVEDAAQKFNMPVEQIAFSRDSVRGVFNWLQGLDPPVVSDEGKLSMFRRRYFCQPLSFLWAVDFLYRITHTTYGVRLSLTKEHMEQICQLCVLDPSGLDNVLMMAKRISDYDRGGIFAYGTEGGFGRWILLARPCPVPILPESGQR